MAAENHRLAAISSNRTHQNSEPSEESASAPSTLGKAQLGASMNSASQRVAVIGMHYGPAHMLVWYTHRQGIYLTACKLFYSTRLDWVRYVQETEITPEQFLRNLPVQG